MTQELMQKLGIDPIDHKELANFVYLHALNYSPGVALPASALKDSDYPPSLKPPTEKDLEISTAEDGAEITKRQQLLQIRSTPFTLLRFYLSRLKCFSIVNAGLPARMFDGIEHPMLCRECPLYHHCLIKNIDFERMHSPIRPKPNKREKAKKKAPKPVDNPPIPEPIPTPESEHLKEKEELLDPALEKLVSTYDIYPDKYPDTDLAEAASWPSTELLFLEELQETEFSVFDIDPLKSAQQIFNFIARIIDPEEITDQGVVEAAPKLVEFINESDLGNSQFKRELCNVVEQALITARKKNKGQAIANLRVNDNGVLNVVRVLEAYIPTNNSSGQKRFRENAQHFKQYRLPDMRRTVGRINPTLARQIHNLWIMTDLTLDDIGKLFPAISIDEFSMRYQEIGLQPKDNHDIAKAANPSRVSIEEAIQIYSALMRNPGTKPDYPELVNRFTLDVAPETLEETLVKYGLVPPRTPQKGSVVEAVEVNITGTGKYKMVRNGTEYMLIDINPRQIRYERITKLGYDYLLALSALQQINRGAPITYNQIYDALVPNYSDRLNPALKVRFCRQLQLEIQETIKQMNSESRAVEP